MSTRTVTWAACGVVFLRFVLAATLIGSGYAKYKNPYAFLITLYHQDLLPQAGSMITAAVLPYLEMVLGVLLLANLCVRQAFLITAVLGVAFVITVSMLLYSGSGISCGCFGLGNQGVSASSLVSSVAVFAGGALGVWLSVWTRRSPVAAVSPVADVQMQT